MATKHLVLLEDDIDGDEAVETVSFSLDDVAYAIDLNEKNAAALREALAPFIGFARKTTRPQRIAASSAPRRKSEARSDLADIRTWGKEHGFAVSERGRISGELQTAYDAAHGGA